MRIRQDPRIILSPLIYLPLMTAGDVPLVAVQVSRDPTFGLFRYAAACVLLRSVAIQLLISPCVLLQALLLRRSQKV